MWVADGWTDYELLDAGYGEKLERWGPYILRRPDPQAVWPADKNSREWLAADAAYSRSNSGGGFWEYARGLPAFWDIGYRRLRFRVKPMQFKHTGVFPEQAVNWDWIITKIGGRNRLPGGTVNSLPVGNTANGIPTNNTANGIPGDIANGLPVKIPDCVRVLSLFAYTGAASVAAASAGARVCHVDAARGMVAMAKVNAALSGVADDRIRYIVDDVNRFVRREIRRGSKYDAVIMDPPAYGRGPGGELWKADTHLYETVELCTRIFAEPPLFFIINTYAAGISATSAENILKAAIVSKFGGRVESGELAIPVSGGDLLLPCGCCARWERI